MPRRKRQRWIAAHPEITGMIPQGIPDAGEVLMSVEEVETLRLIDYSGMDQAGAAVMMRVSRHTVGRILRQARHKLSKALVTGMRIRVHGGCYALRAELPEHGLPESETEKEVNVMPGQNRSLSPGQGTGRGQGSGSGQGRGCGQGRGKGQGQGQGRGCGQGRGQGRGCGQVPAGQGNATNDTETKEE
jgi:predicted DNA-binding protein (UPF0251 family)